MWIKEDQFHSFTKFKPLLKKIKNGQLFLKSVKMWKSEMSSCSYSMFSDELMVQVVKFITNVDVTKDSLKVDEAVTEKTKNTEGKSIVQQKNIVFNKEVDQNQLQQMMQQKNQDQENITRFSQLLDQNKISEMIESRLNNSHPMRSFYKQLINSLPALTPSSLDDPYFLVHNGML